MSGDWNVRHRPRVCVSVADDQRRAAAAAAAAAEPRRRRWRCRSEERLAILRWVTEAGQPQSDWWCSGRAALVTRGACYHAGQVRTRGLDGCPLAILSASRSNAPWLRTRVLVGSVCRACTSCWHWLPNIHVLCLCDSNGHFIIVPKLGYLHVWKSLRHFMTSSDRPLMLILSVCPSVCPSATMVIHAIYVGCGRLKIPVLCSG